MGWYGEESADFVGTSTQYLRTGRGQEVNQRLDLQVISKLAGRSGAKSRSAKTEVKTITFLPAHRGFCLALAGAGVNWRSTTTEL